MRTALPLVLLGGLLPATLAGGPLEAAVAAGADRLADRALPRVFLIDAKALAQTRLRVADDDKDLAPAVAKLRDEADRALAADPFSVMEKMTVPPSGDKHDYMSVGPYWWPDPDKPDGKPYIRRDGQVNPERHQFDNALMSEMGAAVDTLALAYYLTGHEPYAQHAAKLLRAWFLDEATRMNPHLEYGQAIPGRCDGRGIGIIDTTRLVRLVDAVGMLAGSPAWTATDQEVLEAWFGEYLRWMLQSKYGRDESRTRNNHGTWYDVQVASFALFARRDDVAQKVLGEVPARRIATQIEPDGSQPHELARTRSFDYSTMNLRGMFELAALGRCVGVDLWNFQTDDGRGVRKALDWLIPYAAGEKAWQHKQITELRPGRLFPLLRAAAVAYREPRYERLIAELPDLDRAGDRVNLLAPRPEF